MQVKVNNNRYIYAGYDHGITRFNLEDVFIDGKFIMAILIGRRNIEIYKQEEIILKYPAEIEVNEKHPLTVKLGGGKQVMEKIFND